MSFLLTLLTILSSINWNSDTSTTKPIMIYYHTEWCGYCKLLEANVFNDSTISEIVNERYATIKVDCDSRSLVSIRNKRISQRKLCSDNKIRGYPTVILYDSNLKYKKEYLGSSSKRDFLRFIKK